MNRWLATAVLAPVAVTLVPLAADAQTSSGLRVNLKSDPPGASVYVDDGSEVLGVTPATVRLPRGTHRFRFVLEGYATLETEVEIRRSPQEVKVTLQALGRFQLLTSDVELATAAVPVTVDGVQVGTLPLDITLTPGRHLYRVVRNGYHPVERWFEVAGGQTYTAEVVLRPLPEPQGELLVAPDVPGAQVLIDGAASGTTPLVAAVAAGSHVVEIHAEGLDPHRNTVEVTAGSRTVVSPVLRTARLDGGVLRVLTSPDHAFVSVDGEDKGPAPLVVEGLPPGTHIVEVSAAGFSPAVERVTIEAGREETVRIELTGVATTGTVRVTSAVENAELFLDGRPQGIVPLTLRNVAPGSHGLLVRAPGRPDWEHLFTIEAGEEFEIQAMPEGSGTAAGTTGGGTTGGSAQGGTTGTTTGDTGSTGDGTSPPGFRPAVEVTSRAGRYRYTRSAIPLPPLVFSIDAAWGWPWLVGAYRLGLGVYDGIDPARLDLAIEVRSSYWMTEFDARSKIGVRLGGIFGLGAELSVGGGFGQGYEEFSGLRSAFVLGFTLLEGFELDPVAFGLLQRLEVYVDRYAQERATEWQEQAGARVFVGAYVEWAIHKLVNVFLTGDYAPVQDSRRILCGSAWSLDGESCTHDWMKDVNLNLQVGIGVRLF